MRKIFFFIAPILLACIIFIIVQFLFNREMGKGALQVTSVPQSEVFLNGILIGTTPLCKCNVKEMLPIGDYSVRLVARDTAFSPFEEKITIRRSVLTVVDRIFAGGGRASGSVISLISLKDIKSTELQVLSIPEDAEVELDGAKVGKTPLLLQNVSESDHEIVLAKIGYEEKVVRIKITKGYKLVSSAFLGVSPLAQQESTSSSVLGQEQIASVSAPIKQNAPAIIIRQTPTGFLRVRQEPSANSLEIGRVSPGETYILIEEKPGWYKIQFFQEESGWVSSQYATKE